MSEPATEPPPLVPEIRLYRPADGGIMSLWAARAELPPPYYAYPWASGQALARYVLDHRELVEQRRVLDLGTGSGLVAIAAALSGARSVLACDVDPRAIAAARANAALNDVTLELLEGDLLGEEVDVDVILVGDLFYERELSLRVLAFLRRARADVLVGDPGRAHFTQKNFTRVARYDVPGQADLDGRDVRAAGVYRLARLGP